MCAEKIVKKIFIVAGEASGDLLGANLVQSLCSIQSDIECEFVGVAGEMMSNAGVRPIFCSADLAVVGFLEVLPSVCRIVERMKRVLKAISVEKPDVIVTIDSPGFNLRLVKKIREKFGRKIKIIHYVAPTIWAYNAKRAKIIGELFDHILLLLPFECEYFKFMPHTFVGHPVVQISDVYRMQNNAEKMRDVVHSVRSTLGMDDDALLLTVMPGSRRGEITRHVKVLKDAMCGIELQCSKIGRRVKFFIPTVGDMEKLLRSAFSGSNDVVISTNRERKNEIIAASDLAIVKSGTGVIEVAALGVPMVTFYKLSRFTEWFLKYRLNVKFVTLPNILLNTMVVPELLACDFTANKMCECVCRFLGDANVRSEQVRCFDKVMEMLGAASVVTPGMRAAMVVMQYLW